jgi:hypothetical protein
MFPMWVADCLSATAGSRFPGHVWLGLSENCVVGFVQTKPGDFLNCCRYLSASHVCQGAGQNARWLDDVADVLMAIDVWQIEHVAPLTIDLDANLDPSAMGIKPNPLNQHRVLFRSPKMVASL